MELYFQKYSFKKRMSYLEFPEPLRDPLEYDSLGSTDSTSMVSTLSSGSFEPIVQTAGPRFPRTSSPIPIRYPREFIQMNRPRYFPPVIFAPTSQIGLTLGDFPQAELQIRRARSLPALNRELFFEPIRGHFNERSEIEPQNENRVDNNQSKWEKSDFGFALVLAIMIGLLIYLLSKLA